jgi:hypothetical protein
MSRWKRLEQLQLHLHEMTAEELRRELPFWREHAEQLSGPAHKLALKRIHKLERALELKEREVDPDAVRGD